jgi:hypothetical protein
MVSWLIIIVSPNTYKPALAQQQEQQNKQFTISIVGSIRENCGNLTATSHPPLNANSTYYTFTKNRSEVSTPENNSYTNEFGNGTRIALVDGTGTLAIIRVHTNTIHQYINFR